jgi:exodeoxyribonuclease V alpha subunit
VDILSGSIERITYYNPENGYSVVRLRPDRHLSTAVRGASREGLVTLTGNLPELSPGEYVRLRGSWSMHAKHGMQFQVEFCEQALPATVSGIRRYLGSGLIKGIGPKLAERIVDQFGAQTLEVIEQQPERLAEVEDIGPKRSSSIAKAWEEQKQVKEIMLFLHSHGVSTNLAVKIYKTYGDESLQIVQTDPYRLARDIFGIGFKTADRIARALGLSPDHPSRIEAGIVYVLNEMSGEGHVFAPQPVLTELAAQLLEVPKELIIPAIERLSVDDRVRVDQLPLQIQESEPKVKSPAQTMQTVMESPAGYDQPAVYLTPIFYGEVGVAERLRILASSKVPSGPVERVILSRSREAIQGLGDLSLSEEQQKAIQIALTRPVSVLTGGPGTGKTTALKALIASLEALKKSYALTSPTGRAAKRLSEATGRPASTIHRLLGFSPGEGFEFSAQNPLPVDMLVVDEASMLDLLLANNLLKALRPGTHLLLVGDVDQLPSVGAGDVLRDVIASGLAPFTSLSTIFRQAAGSQIITNAHRINQGQMPVFSSPASSKDGGTEGDFFLFPAETAEEAANWVVQVVTDRIPRRFKLHPRDDVQVLSPMYRGPAGVHALNERLQAELNPPDSRKPEKALFGTLFRLGDKVMQTQNNYDKDVYNGDIGKVIGLNLIEHILTVDFEGKEVNYDFVEADQLVLAYAVSVHKAQGSEFPAVVIPLVTGHYMMLQRNLLYTAVTRAKRLCVLSGSKKAIAMAVHNNKVAHRYTALDWRLRVA